jgi:hypothetical protein
VGLSDAGELEAADSTGAGCVHYAYDAGMTRNGPEIAPAEPLFEPTKGKYGSADHLVHVILCFPTVPTCS